MKKAFIFLSLIFILLSCEPVTNEKSEKKDDTYIEIDSTQRLSFDESNDPIYNFTATDEKEFTYNLMKEIYFWNTTMPKINLNNYSTASDVMDAMLNEKDKWSSIVKKSKNEAYYSGASFYGYGFFPYWLSGDIFRIEYIQEDSVFYKAGVRRGDQILEIDHNSDIAGMIKNGGLSDILQETEEENETHHFKFKTKSNQIIEGNYTKSTMNIKTILYSSVIEANSKKVGYFVFTSFIKPSIDELKTVFTDFENENIDELVIDLRNNSGGLVYVADYIINVLLGSNYENQTSMEYNFNNKYKSWNEPVKIEKTDYNFNFNRVIFLTSWNTASASELVINSLSAYIDVKLIGFPTHGKPVGMIGFEYGENIYKPISFQLVNSNSYANYFDGLAVDSYIYDTSAHEYGDISEPLLAEALYYIKNGRFTSRPYSRSIQTRSSDLKILESKGFNREILLF